MGNDRFEAALALAAALPSASEQIPRIHARHAAQLLRQKRFQEAFHHLGLSDVPPGQVVGLVPRTLPQEAPLPALVEGLELDAAEEKAFLEAAVPYFEAR